MTPVGEYILTPVKDLLNGKRSVQDLTDHDFRYDVKQKGVDIRIGIDGRSAPVRRCQCGAKAA